MRRMLIGTTSVVLVLTAMLASGGTGVARRANPSGVAIRGVVAAADADAGTVTIDRKGAPDLMVHRGLDSKIKKNGVPATLANVVAGDRVAGAFRLVQGEKVIKVLKARTPQARRVSGQLTGANLARGTIAIRIRNGQTITVGVPDSALVRVGRLSGSLANLHVGWHVRALVSRTGATGAGTEIGDEVANLDQQVEAEQARGAVVSVDPVAGTMTIETEGSELTVAVDDHTIIYREDYPAALDDFEAGDRVKVKYVVDGETNVAITIDGDGAEDHSYDELHGRIEAVGEASIDVATEHEGTVTLLIDEGTTIFRNEEEASLADLQSGDKVEALFHESSDGLTADRVRAEAEHGDDDDHDRHVDGIISKVGADSVTIAPKHGEHDGNAVRAAVTLLVTDETEIYRDGEETTLADLQVGDRAGARFHREGESFIAEKIKAKSTEEDDEEPKGFQVQGKITAAGDGSVTIAFKHEHRRWHDGATANSDRVMGALTLQVTDETEIYRGSEEATLADLAVGDRAAAKFRREGDVLIADRIKAKSAEEPEEWLEVDGEIAELGDGSVTIATGEGDEVVLIVTDGTRIMRDDIEATFADLQMGDGVHAVYRVANEHAFAAKIRAHSPEPEDPVEDVSSVEGVIALIDGDWLKIETPDAEFTWVKVVDETVIDRNDEPAVFADLQAGDEVWVEYHGSGDAATANLVEAYGA